VNSGSTDAGEGGQTLKSAASDATAVSQVLKARYADWLEGK